MKYKHIQHSDVEQYFPDAKLRGCDTHGNCWLRYRGKHVGPHGRPHLDIILAGNEVPILCGGMPCDSERNAEIAEAIFGYRIAFVTQLICRDLDCRARIAFVKESDKGLVVLTNNPYEAKYFLITDIREDCWEEDLIEKNRKLFSKLIAASKYVWLGDPVHRKKTPGVYRNFFLIPVGYHANLTDTASWPSESLQEQFAAAAQAFIDDQLYCGFRPGLEEFSEWKLLSEASAKYVLALMESEYENAKNAQAQPDGENDEKPSEAKADDENILKTHCLIDEMYYKYTYVITKEGLIIAPQVVPSEQKYVAELYEWHHYHLEPEWLVVRIEADWSQPSPSRSVRLLVLQKPKELSFHAKKRAEMILQKFKNQQFRHRYEHVSCNEEWSFVHEDANDEA